MANSKKRRQWSCIAYVLVAVAALAGCTTVPRATPVEASLPTSALTAIHDAVLEVVVPKPEMDSLEYEKPLPMDLIPYAVRTDKYYSIGTAFLIRPGEFISGAHVMPLGSGSQFKEVYLRDSTGTVYPVDKILKYASDRDFIVFTVKNWTDRSTLPVNTAPQLNQKVYSVGNALAQGIVIRDGLYTSNTPEEEAGQWQWQRFSAAASPGNSGGPLLDQGGKVIGIVLQKSENENLNYALPITEVLKAPENRAVLKMKLKYVLDNMDMTKIDTLHKEISLPKTYGELDKEMTEAFVLFSGSLLKEFLAENRQVIFPRGEGSTALLNKDYNAVFPHVIAKDKDGSWDAFEPKETRDADLGNNGFLEYGRVGVTYYFYIHKPDDISMKRFVDDSKLFMDLLLKGVYVYRGIGSEKIKIVSMGKAQEEYPFTDSYGRKWMVRTWRQEYNDQMCAVISLPVPGGSIAMLRVGDTGAIHSGHIPDLKVLTDFIYLSYYGTFKEWREFLTLQDKLPSIFSTLDIRMDNNKSFSLHSPRFSASYGPDLMTVSDNSDLNLRFSYFQDQGKTVWDIDGIVIGDSKHNKVCYTIFRYAPPPEALSDKFQSQWQKVVERQFPFNRSAYAREDTTSIRTVYGKTPQGQEKESPELLYAVGYTGSGTVAQEEMETKLDGFVKNMKVYEIDNTGKALTVSRGGAHLGKR